MQRDPDNCCFFPLVIVSIRSSAFLIYRWFHLMAVSALHSDHLDCGQRL